MTAARSSCFRRGRATASSSCSCAGPTRGSARFTSSTRGGGRSRAVTRRPALFAAALQPGRRSIVFERSTGGSSPRPCGPRSRHLSDSRGGRRAAATHGQRAQPALRRSGDRIYYTEDAQPAKETEPAHELVSVDLNGKDRRVHARSHYATRMEVSPDGEWLAFRENYHVYVAPCRRPDSSSCRSKMKSLPMRRATRYRRQIFRAGRRRHADLDPRSRRFIRRRWLSCSRRSRRPTASDADEDSEPRKARRARRRPHDHAARGQTVRRGCAHGRPHHHDERGGPSHRRRRDRRARQPYRRRRRGGRRADSRRGEAPRPGRSHGHARPDRHSCARSAGRERHRAAAELVGARAPRAGRDDGARPVESGDRDFRRCGVSARRPDSRPAHLLDRRVIYGAHDEGFASIDKLEDARNHVQRLKAQGAISVKNYNQPRREQRQMVVDRGAGSRPDGRRRRRFAVSHGHEHHRRRQYGPRAQPAAGAVL